MNINRKQFYEIELKWLRIQQDYGFDEMLPVHMLIQKVKSMWSSRRFVTELNQKILANKTHIFAKQYCVLFAKIF